MLSILITKFCASIRCVIIAIWLVIVFQQIIGIITICVQNLPVVINGKVLIGKLFCLDWLILARLNCGYIRTSVFRVVTSTRNVINERTYLPAPLQSITINFRRRTTNLIEGRHFRLRGRKAIYITLNVL